MPRAAKTERDSEIVRLAGSGVLHSVIAQQFGIGAPRVREIVELEAAKLRRLALDKANGKGDAVKSAIRAKVFRDD